MNTNRLNQKSLFQSAFEGMSFNTAQYNFAPKRKANSFGIPNMTNILTLMTTRLQAPFESLTDKLSNLTLNGSQFTLAHYAIMIAKIVKQMDAYGCQVSPEVLHKATAIYNAVNANKITVPKWLQEIYDYLSPTKLADGRVVIPIIPDIDDDQLICHMLMAKGDDATLATKMAPEENSSMELSSIHATLAFELKFPDIGSVAAAYMAGADLVWNSLNKTTFKTDFLSTLTYPATSTIDVKDIPNLGRFDVPFPVFAESEQSTSNIFVPFLHKDGNSYKLKNSSSYKSKEIQKVAQQHMAYETSNTRHLLGGLRALKLAAVTKDLRAFSKTTANFFDDSTWGSASPSDYVDTGNTTTGYFFGNKATSDWVHYCIQNLPLLSAGMNLGDEMALNLETENGEDSFAALALKTLPMQVGDNAERDYVPLTKTELSVNEKSNDWETVVKLTTALKPTKHGANAIAASFSNKKNPTAQEITNNCLLSTGKTPLVIDDNDKFTLLHFHPWEMPCNRLLVRFVHNVGEEEADLKNFNPPNTWPSCVDLNSVKKSFSLSDITNVHHFGKGWDDQKYLRRALNSIDLTSRKHMGNQIANTPFINAQEFDLSDDHFNVWNAIVNSLKMMRMGSAKNQDKISRPKEGKNEFGKALLEAAEDKKPKELEPKKTAVVPKTTQSSTSIKPATAIKTVTTPGENLDE